MNNFNFFYILEEFYDTYYNWTLGLSFGKSNG